MVYREPSGFGASFGYQLTPWVKRLLIANAVLFLVLIAVPWPLVRDWLAFTPARVLVSPWTLVTYMFVHAGFFHLFFNMLILFFFGPPLESMWGGREFLRFYIVAGLGGAVLSVFFAPNIPIVGASGAIYGVMLAFAMNWPNMSIYIWGILPVKAKWLVGFLAAMSIAALAGGAQDNVAHWAHLGGFGAGFLYLKFNDQMTSRVDRLKTFVSRRRDQVDKAMPTKGESASARRTRQRDEDRVLDEVDRVLDKISTSGIQSLSEEELRLLDDVSKRYRQN
jgi:membrane associated rhomboid family serine protease